MTNPKTNPNLTYTPHQNHKKGYHKLALPQPGTKTRAILIDLIITGLTAKEASVKHSTTVSAFAGVLERLKNDYGYDIRGFPIQRAGKGEKPHRFKVVGRLTDNGYIDHVALNLKEYLSNDPSE